MLAGHAPQQTDEELLLLAGKDQQLREQLVTKDAALMARGVDIQCLTRTTPPLHLQQSEATTSSCSSVVGLVPSDAPQHAEFPLADDPHAQLLGMGAQSVLINQLQAQVTTFPSVSSCSSSSGNTEPQGGPPSQPPEPQESPPLDVHDGSGRKRKSGGGRKPKGGEDSPTQNGGQRRRRYAPGGGDDAIASSATRLFAPWDLFKQPCPCPAFSADNAEIAAAFPGGVDPARRSSWGRHMSTAQGVSTKRAQRAFQCAQSLLYLKRLRGFVDVTAKTLHGVEGLLGQRGPGAKKPRQDLVLRVSADGNVMSSADARLLKGSLSTGVDPRDMRLWPLVLTTNQISSKNSTHKKHHTKLR